MDYEVYLYVPTASPYVAGVSADVSYTQTVASSSPAQEIPAGGISTSIGEASYNSVGSLSTYNQILFN